MVRRGRILRVVLPLACVGRARALVPGGADGRAGQGRRPRAQGGRRLQAPAAAATSLRADRIPGPRRHPLHRRRPAAGADRSDPRFRPRRPAADPRPAGLRTPLRSPRSAPRSPGDGARARSSAPGSIGVTLLFDGGAVPAHAPLTLFNGPRRREELPGARPRPHRLAGEPDLRRPGPDRTAPGRIPLPAPASTFPASPAAACSPTSTPRSAAATGPGGTNAATPRPAARDGIFRTHGHFLFSDGMIIDGAIEKPCVPAGS